MTCVNQNKTLAELVAVAAQTMTDYETALVVVRLDGGRSVCTTTTKSVWYTLKNGLWEQLIGCSPVFQTYLKAVGMIKKRIHADFDAEMSAALTERDEKIALRTKTKRLKQASVYGSNSKTKNVDSLVSKILVDGKFADSLDQNLDLVGLGGAGI